MHLAPKTSLSALTSCLLGILVSVHFISSNSGTQFPQQTCAHHRAPNAWRRFRCLGPHGGAKIV